MNQTKSAGPSSTERYLYLCAFQWLYMNYLDAYVFQWLNYKHWATTIRVQRNCPLCCAVIFLPCFSSTGSIGAVELKKKVKLDSIQCSQRQWNQLPRFVSTTVIAVCGIESLAVLGRVQNERLILPVLVDFILYSETEAKQKGQIGSAFNLFPILFINFSLFFSSLLRQIGSANWWGMFNCCFPIENSHPPPKMIGNPFLSFS